MARVIRVFLCNLFLPLAFCIRSAHTYYWWIKLLRTFTLPNTKISSSRPAIISTQRGVNYHVEPFLPPARHNGVSEL
jgi:hypothetical protein